MWRRALLLVMLAALLAAACGDDDGGSAWGPPTTGTATTGGQTTGGGDTTTTTGVATTQGSGDSQALADQIAADVLASGGDSELPLDQEAAQCIGDGVVQALGAPRIQELSAAGGGDLGAGLEGMTDSEVSAVLPVVLGCVDVNGLIVDSMTQAGISAQGASCVANAITQGTFIQDMLTLLTASSDTTEMDPAVIQQVMGQVTPMLTGCLTPEELQLLGFGGPDQ